MKKVVFVCTGNTCRSPMAEGYLKFKKPTGYEIVSRGLAADGSPAATHSVNAMLEKGIDISSHISKQMGYGDAETADVIVCMSSSHADLLEALGVDKLKIHILGISDPFGCGIDRYRECRDEIFSAVDELIEDNIL
ncbi:MAG: low molecular weight phosphatase family protein [Ruminococcaceae bacterium]|nr:low molecular weight phosphatase family protein [Oscillospiraceae bacterium]